ncbi:mycothiol transferase [Streptacidiphilus neutrinimicus]|uniref:mycothiol transferase n=1 Tax=Streptacidiphilus neutrinimicus TaxID=105420 RepID=UPI000694D286
MPDASDGSLGRQGPADYHAAIAASHAAIRSARGLGNPVAVPVEGAFLSVRWVVAHMTSETARHAGHADILRERIDGTTGR